MVYRPSGIAHYLGGDYGYAIREFQAWYDNELLLNESIPWLAAAYAQKGDIPMSREVIKELTQRDRGFGNLMYREALANRYIFSRTQDRELFMEGLGKAGLPKLDDD